MTVMTDWIRPWYPAGPEGHIYADCEHLLRARPEPAEGSGWLDPHGRAVCQPCRDRHTQPWDAECGTCDGSMVDDWEGDEPFTEADAKRWMADHECPRVVRIIAPPPRENPAPAVPDGQTALFSSDLQDAA